MAKKSKVQEKLESKQVTTGALPAVTLQQRMGFNRFPYPETTLDEYRAKLEKLDLADLQHHAVAVANVVPNVDKRNLLVDKLLVAYQRKAAQMIEDPNRSRQPDTSEAMSKLMARGR